MIEALRIAAAPLLTELPRAAWLPHGLVRKPNGKLDKPPRCGATTSNQSSWFTLEAALATIGEKNDVMGVGFAITKGLIGLDFDDCRNPATGEIVPAVQAELEKLNSFAYVTPSQTGIRIVGTNPGQMVTSGKKVRFLPGGYKVEIFVGPTNHYNTFTADIIEGYETVRDIAADVLEWVSYLPGSDKEDAPPDEVRASGEPQRSVEAIRATLAVIPNPNKNWDAWSHVGMAAYASSGGSAEGREAFRDWSAKHPCHDDASLDERWRHWRISPPTKLGFGTLYYMARQARPLFVAPFDPADHDAEYADEPQPKKAKSTSRIRLLSMDELDDLEDPKWLIEGLVPERSLVMPFGPPKKGKTFIVLSMALHIADGRDWAGKRVEQGGVVFIAGEGVGGLKMRLKAMRSHYGISSRLPFWVVPGAVNFSQPGAVEELIKTVREKVLDEPIALIVVDTLARAMPGVDENSSQEIGLVIASCDRLKEEFDCTVMPIHHAGKDATKGLRGSSAIHGAVDASFSVTSAGTRLTLTPVDQKEADPGPAMVFDMVTVPVGIGGSSLVPVLSGDTSGDAHEAGGVVLTDLEMLALKALETALVDYGTQPRVTSQIPPNVTCVTDAQWRQSFQNLRPGEKPNTVRVALNRIAMKLTIKNIIGASAPYYWRV